FYFIAVYVKQNARSNKPALCYQFIARIGRAHSQPYISQVKTVSVGARSVISKINTAYTCAIGKYPGHIPYFGFIQVYPEPPFLSPDTYPDAGIAAHCGE